MALPILTPPTPAEIGDTGNWPYAPMADGLRVWTDDDGNVAGWSSTHGYWLAAGCVVSFGFAISEADFAAAGGLGAHYVSWPDPTQRAELRRTSDDKVALVEIPTYGSGDPVFPFDVRPKLSITATVTDEASGTP